MVTVRPPRKYPLVGISGDAIVRLLRVTVFYLGFIPGLILLPLMFTIGLRVRGNFRRVGVQLFPVLYLMVRRVEGIIIRAKKSKQIGSCKP